MFVDSYFQVATHLFEQYTLQMPLHLFLKEYFSNNKKYGSRDRKYIAEMLYGIYRLGKTNDHLTLKERFTIGSFLSNRIPILFYEKVDKRFALKFPLSFLEKMKWVESEFNCNFKLPFNLSEGITENMFFENLYSQPKVFIRIRQNKLGIIESLKKHKIEYEALRDDCFSFANNVKLDEVLNPSDYVIQDYSSQEVGNYLHPQSKENWWDVCCASGGKSIMLLDKNRTIDLTVTDVRASIIQNLSKRFQVYGYISQYVAHCVDATQDVSKVIRKKMDAILYDVPCSGSGTWARSPEQFYFFDENKLKEFTDLQYTIVSNTVQYLKPEGRLVYVTCSVLQAENEDIINRLQAENDLIFKSQDILNGFEHGGDAMFVACL